MSAAPRVTAKDVGSYWTREDGSVWRLQSYCEYPTVTWERLDGRPLGYELRSERRGGAVGSQITEGFIRLVPAYDPIKISAQSEAVG